MTSAFPLPRTGTWPVSDRRTSENENRRLATVATNAPRVPWDKFSKNVLQWKSGEHLALIGPTGLGKTTMLLI